MTTLAFRHLARTIARSKDHAEPCMILIDGEVIETGATWLRREGDEQLERGKHIVMETTIRVPADLFADDRPPRFPDSVTVGGKPYFVQEADLKGPVYLISLTTKGPRNPAP